MLSILNIIMKVQVCLFRISDRSTSFISQIPPIIGKRIGRNWSICVWRLADSVCTKGETENPLWFPTLSDTWWLIKWLNICLLLFKKKSKCQQISFEEKITIIIPNAELSVIVSVSCSYNFNWIWCESISLVVYAFVRWCC